MKKTLLALAMIATTATYAQATVRAGVEFDQKPNNAFLVGVQGEYALPVYQINDNVEFEVAAGAEAKFGFTKGTIVDKSVVYTETTKESIKAQKLGEKETAVKTAKDALEKATEGEKTGKQQELTRVENELKTAQAEVQKLKDTDVNKETNLEQKANRIVAGVYIAPKLSYKASEEMTVKAGVKLGLAYDTVMYKETEIKDLKGKIKVEGKQEEVNETKLKAETKGGVVMPLAFVAGVEYNQISVNAEIGGKFFLGTKKEANKEETKKKFRLPAFGFVGSLNVGYSF